MFSYLNKNNGQWGGPWDQSHSKREARHWFDLSPTIFVKGGLRRNWGGDPRG